MIVGMLTDPVLNDAMSGRSSSALPREAGSRPRPPVENCTIMPGQCRRTPSCTAVKRAGSLDGFSSSSRTWMCTSDAPASNAACVLSICSAGWVGTAGLSRLRGTDPVIATAMAIGFMLSSSCVTLPCRHVAPCLCGYAHRRIGGAEAGIASPAFDHFEENRCLNVSV